jgi:hypothetical protein
MPRTRSSSKNNSTANLGFEAKLVCDEVTAIFVTIIKRARERLSSNVRMQELPPSSFFLRTSSSPRGNANFAWVQHFIHHLAPHGMAGFVLVRFWFLVKLKAARVIKGLDNSTSDSFRERRRETLFIDARKLGKLIDRRCWELITFRKCIAARCTAGASVLSVPVLAGDAGFGLVALPT